MIPVFIYLQNPLRVGNIQLQKNEVGIVIKSTPGSSVVEFPNLDHSIEVKNTELQKFDPFKTGDNYDKKICNVCNRLLPIEEFDKNQNGKNNRTVRRPSCNECRKQMDGKPISLSVKKKWERIKPYCTIWRCPICKKVTIPGITSKVVLDHDHITGQPRAWICDSCNTGLGRFKDNPKILLNAIKYLEEARPEDC